MVKEEDLSAIIVLGMLFLIALGISFIHLTRKNRKIKQLANALLKEELEKKELEKAGIAITTQEKERSEIARKLHDEVGGILSMAQLNLSLAAQVENNEDDQNYVLKAANLLDIGNEQLRTITKGLVPHYLVKFGLSKALEKTISQKMGQLTTKYTFKSNLTEDVEVEENKMIHFFNISSELITNLMKHSRPDKVDIELSLDGDQLQLHIKHNGLALSQNDYEKFSQESDSLGLMNIRYRLHLINGQLKFSRTKSTGEILLITTLILS
jgi:two-component system NarL family sensor kinase